MDDLLGGLSRNQRVLDLGCGPGSFNYTTVKARIFSLDRYFVPDRERNCLRVIADSRQLPFSEQAFDLVICHHTLEHFEQPERVVKEVDRVLGPDGHFFASIPDGYSFSDNLYRWLTKGGGHVNRFRFSSFSNLIESHAQLRAYQYQLLLSSFIYLNPPGAETLKALGGRTRLFFRFFTPSIARVLLPWINYAARVLDRFLGTGLSRYGWAFWFRRGDEAGVDASQLPALPIFFNVCYACGAGHPDEGLIGVTQRKLLTKRWRCGCGSSNILFRGAPAWQGLKGLT